MNNHVVTWKYEYCKDTVTKDTVTFQFDLDGQTPEDMFFRWVEFMNAIGYSLNNTEMFEMWNGVK